MKQNDSKRQQISIIIPTLNEENNIERVLSDLIETPGAEVILVDGGSKDATVQAASTLGVRIISTSPGRALQMNAGAAVAEGDILLFLHADTTLPRFYGDYVRKTLSSPHVAGGAFKLAINAPGFRLRLIELLANWRSTFFQMPYGDQAFFLTAEMFRTTGGFSELPIMEDFEFISRLRKKGQIRTLPIAATTSARRWLELGVIKTTLINQGIIIGYYLGIDPTRLSRWYRVARG